MEPVLTQSGLAALLHAEEGIVARLLVETDIPHIHLAGEVRFITEDVLTWLREPRGSILAPETVPSIISEAAPGPTTVGPARAGEQPFLSTSLLTALDERSSDASANEDRLQLRDLLLELGSGLSDTLFRLSGARLSLDPDAPTSPWQWSGAEQAPIQALTMCWGVRGSSGSTGANDQPHISLSLSAHEISLALRVPEGIDPPVASAVRNLKASGAEMGYGVEDGSWLAAYRYPIATGAPTLLALQVQLEADLERLVPLWERTFTQISG